MLREKSFSQEGFDSGQPAQFAQDDLSRYRWLFGIPHCSVVKCSTRNPGVLLLSFFVDVSLGKKLQSPSLVLVKPRKDSNNVSCHCDMTEILLIAA